MTYVLTDGASTVVTYPYSVYQLKQDNKTVSFPASPDDALLADFNVLPVIETAPPAYDPLTQTLTEINPTTSDGGVTWTQAWQVDNLSQEGAQAFYDAQVASVQAQIKSLQNQIQTFYTEAMIAGYGFSPEMLAYIDAISDPTSLPDYPLVSQFPVLPENRLDANNTSLPVAVFTRQEINTRLANLPTLTTELSAAISSDLVTEFEQSLI